MELLLEALAGHYSGRARARPGAWLTVYPPDDPSTVLKVAIKLSIPELAAPLGRTAFSVISEIAARALQHPHILPSTTPEPLRLPLLLHPYVEARRFAPSSAGKALSGWPTLKITAQVASALILGARRGVVHRDRKPEHIMMRSNAVVADSASPARRDR